VLKFSDFYFYFGNTRDLCNFLHRLTLTSKTGSKITNKNHRDICVKEIVHSAAEEAWEAIWERRAGRPAEARDLTACFPPGRARATRIVRSFGGYPISPDIVVPGHPLNSSTHSTFF
jgi:hypothetical protein